jgi:hypothetical protein
MKGGERIGDENSVLGRQRRVEWGADTCSCEVGDANLQPPLILFEWFVYVKLRRVSPRVGSTV